MNITAAIIVDLKSAPECIKVHHFEVEHAKLLVDSPSPDPTPTGEGRPLPRPHPWRRLRRLHPSAFVTRHLPPTAFLDTAGVTPAWQQRCKDISASVHRCPMPTDGG